jgi:hypothetical protein
MPNSGRSRLREKAVIALVREPTIEKAAQVTGVGLRTLQRWLTDATFQEAMRKAKSDLNADLMADAIAQLRVAFGTTVKVLVSIANNRRASSASRVSACRCILEMGVAADVQERLLILERQGRSHEKFSID